MEYLRVFRLGHAASTYNNHICVLREICRVVADKAGVTTDPWESVRLLPDDSHTRREFSIDELCNIMANAKRKGGEWRLLISIGMYTGLRLGDCCRLTWSEVDLEHGILQVIPQKTKKHAHGHPVTIPIHPQLLADLQIINSRRTSDKGSGCYVLPQMAEWYLHNHWRVGHGLKEILNESGIITSVRIEGRRQNTPDATFHSLRHTFVSFAANAGVPLPVVASIVGHTSTAMTRHYYHESIDALRAAVAAVPTIVATNNSASATERVEFNAGNRDCIASSPLSTRKGASTRQLSPAQRLKRLDQYFAKGIITKEEHDAQRTLIISAL